MEHEPIRLNGLTRRAFLGSTARAVAGTCGLSLSFIRKAAGETQLTFLAPQMFIPATEEMLRKQTAYFSKRFRGAVELEFVDQRTRAAKVSAVLSAGTGADIVALTQGEAMLYEQRLRSVDGLCERLSSEYGPWPPVIKASNFMNGHWKAVGWHCIPYAPVYRKDMLEQAGCETFPDTWHDLLRCAEALKKRYLPPVALTLGHGATDAEAAVYPCLWAFGGKEFESDGKTIAIRSKQTELAIEYMRHLYDYMDPSVIAWNDSSNNRAILGEGASVTINTASIYYVAKRNRPDLAKEINYTLPWKGPSGRFGIGVPVSLGIPKYTKNAALAEKYIEYLLNRNQFTEWLKQGAGNYAAVLDYNNGFRESNPRIRSLKDVPKYTRWPGYAGPSTPSATAIRSRSIIVDMFADVIKGTPMKSAILKAEDEMRRIVK